MSCVVCICIDSSAQLWHKAAIFTHCARHRQAQLCFVHKTWVAKVWLVGFLIQQCKAPVWAVTLHLSCPHLLQWVCFWVACPHEHQLVCLELNGLLAAWRGHQLATRTHRGTCSRQNSMEAEQLRRHGQHMQAAEKRMNLSKACCWPMRNRAIHPPPIFLNIRHADWAGVA